MARALLVALACAACAACAAAARYGDYAGARMPLYGGGDYDAREPHGPVREPDDYRGHSPDAPAALDYKYEEDLSNSQIEKTDPPPGKDVEESESWQQRPARKHKKSRVVDDVNTDPMDRFDPNDDFPKRRGNRFTKHHTRLKSRKFERQDDDSPKYPVNHRGRNVDSDIEEESQLDKDFRNDKSKSYDDERYAHRVGSERVVRRKPRDRQMRKKVELDSEELDKAIADPDQWMPEGLGRAPPPGPLETPGPSQTPGRPAKRRRPEEPEPVRFFREEEDEDESSPQSEKSRKKLNEYEEYGSEYYDMKRVMNIKKKLPSLMRRTTTTPVTEPQWTTVTNVAERELTAILGARRQRKDAPAQGPGASEAPLSPDAPGPTTTRLPPTFPPHALSPALDRQWNVFIAANSASAQHHLSTCLTFLVLINYLESYSSIFCYIKQLWLTKLLSAYSDYEQCFIS